MRNLQRRLFSKQSGRMRSVLYVLCRPVRRLGLQLELPNSVRSVWTELCHLLWPKRQPVHVVLHGTPPRQRFMHCVHYLWQQSVPNIAVRLDYRRAMRSVLHRVLDVQRSGLQRVHQLCGPQLR